MKNVALGATAIILLFLVVFAWASYRSDQLSESKLWVDCLAKGMNATWQDYSILAENLICKSQYPNAYKLWHTMSPTTTQ